MAFVRVAAVGDLHCTKTSQGAFQPLFAAIREAADVLLIAGDLTDYGLPEEAQILARELSAVRIPVVAVLGNHDRESGKEAEVGHVLSESGTIVLDGDATEVKGVGIAGVTGFGGGFGKHEFVGKADSWSPAGILHGLNDISGVWSVGEHDGK